jgi:hypothetical protein
MDPAPALELIQTEVDSTQMNLSKSVKAKRRQGVSDLRILPLFFSLSRDSADWRFTHCDSDSGEDEEVLEFPRPPTSALDVRTVCSRYSHSPHSSVDSIVSESDCSQPHSGCSSPTSSGPPTTPTTPTYSTQTQTQMQKPCLVRCKTVRPQSTTNRSAAGVPSLSVPPLPPAAPPSSSAPALASSTTLYQAISEEADAAEYYAAHACAFVALAPPLPLPLPLSHPAATSSVSASAAPAAESASLSTASLAGTRTASVDPSTTQRVWYPCLLANGGGGKHKYFIPASRAPASQPRSAAAASAHRRILLSFSFRAFHGLLYPEPCA